MIKKKIIPIKIDKSNVLDKTCYIGDIGEEIDNREMYIGVLNYLCKEFEEKNVFIKSEEIGKNMQESKIVAKTSGSFSITFYSDNIKKYEMKEDIEIARIVFHEYVHLLMFRHMSNGFTIENKSKELVNSISSKYNNLPNEALYPTEYANTSYKEQIAEIIGIYLARKTRVASIVVVNNFEKDMYQQFILNIKD